MRDQLMHEYGVDPDRVRIVYGGYEEDDPHHPRNNLQAHYSRSNRAVLREYGLDQHDPTPDPAHRDLIAEVLGIEVPERFRAALIAAVLGPDTETARQRAQRAQAVIGRIDAAATTQHGRPARPEKIAVLWVRDGRTSATAQRNGLDTPPGLLYQTIAELRDADPDRHIVLVGDDIFHQRPGLREGWEAEGLLAGVDTDSMVRFWNARDNGGRAWGLGEQELVFHLLHAQRDIIQFGTVSGAWKNLVLGGIRSVYYEPEVYQGNKAGRWGWDWMPQLEGDIRTVTRPDGSAVLDASGHTLQYLDPTGRRSGPVVRTSERVFYGPALPAPTDGQEMGRSHYPLEQGWFPYERGFLTAYRIGRLVETDGASRDELERWTERLGVDTAATTDRPITWTDDQWHTSRYYAEQLYGWLYTQPESQYEVNRKWDAIRLALRGILEPDFDTDPEVPSHTPVHPYYLLRTTHRAPDEVLLPLRQAYTRDRTDRPRAVVAALRPVLSDPQLRRQAARDDMRFQFTEPERRELRRAIDRFVTDDNGRHSGDNRLRSEPAAPRSEAADGPDPSGDRIGSRPSDHGTDPWRSPAWPTDSAPAPNASNRAHSGPFGSRHFPPPGLVINTNDPVRIAGLRTYSLWVADIANRGSAKLHSRWDPAASGSAHRRALSELYMWVSHQRYVHAVWADERNREQTRDSAKSPTQPSKVRHDRLHGPRLGHPDMFRARMRRSELPGIDTFDIKGRLREGAQYVEHEPGFGRWEGGAETFASRTFQGAGEWIRHRFASEPSDVDFIIR